MICKKCNSEFPIRAFVYGKERNLSRRSYCLDCSPFGSGNRVSLIREPVDYLTPRICTICGKQYIYDRKKGHRTNHCNSCKTVTSDKRKKLKAIEYKGGKCVVCGYNRYFGSLTFHHIDPSTKSYNISWHYNYAWEELKKELDKCVLICSNCHGEVHGGLIEL